jgi:hypothetical protein
VVDYKRDKEKEKVEEKKKELMRIEVVKLVNLSTRRKPELE